MKWSSKLKMTGFARYRCGPWAAAVVVGLIAATVTVTIPVGAQTPSALLPPEASGNCDGQVPIVVASDAAAQSDVYSAATLAGVINTTCVIPAGARDQSMDPVHKARLDRASSCGYVVGGTSAVPASKTQNYSLNRIAGADRWQTSRAVGQEAVLYTEKGPWCNREANVSASVKCDPVSDIERIHFINGKGRQTSESYYNYKHGHEVYPGAECTWNIKNNFQQSIRVAIRALPVDASGALVPGGHGETLDGGYLLIGGATAELYSDLWFGGSKSEVETLYKQWKSLGGRYSVLCRYWTDVAKVQYPGESQSRTKPCAM